jgi:hypothetical protein
MVAGLPGAGIGGLFYLITALLLPLRALWRWVRRMPVGTRPGAVATQVVMALAILAGIWGTGWLLGAVVAPDLARPPSATGFLRYLPGSSANVVRIAALMAGFGTLGMVLLGVEVARVLVRGRSGSVARAATREDAGA